jgi:hypothetical protein
MHMIKTTTVPWPLPEIRDGEDGELVPSRQRQIERVVVDPVIQQHHALREALALAKPGHATCNGGRGGHNVSTKSSEHDVW